MPGWSFDYWYGWKSRQLINKPFPEMRALGKIPLVRGLARRLARAMNAVRPRSDTDLLFATNHVIEPELHARRSVLWLRPGKPLSNQAA